MRVIGFDPGLKITGFGVIESNGKEIELVQAGIIKAKANQELSERLKEIYLGVSEILKETKADEIAIEDLYSHYKHPRTAILMGHARGIIFLVAGELGIKVFSYSAKRIKKALTGNGSASKLQVQRCVKARLGLKELPKPADVADALAVAICHLNQAQKHLWRERN